MITEDYVSFETAKLLKEKGFEGRMHTFYTEEGTEMESAYMVPNNFFPIYRPTLQMAMKWLREKHNLHISVLITYQYFPRKYEVHIMHTEKYEDIVVNPGTNFNTNEEACESAIRYTLENLI